jgi:hypothetical protein
MLTGGFSLISVFARTRLYRAKFCTGDFDTWAFSKLERGSMPSENAQSHETEERATT